MPLSVAGIPVTVIVVDDEPLAREGVRALLAEDPDIAVLQLCASGQSAIRAIVDLSPNIVFLDVQMPGMSGFEVIRTVGVDRMPFIIFTTAFDQYALDAFEAHALEYLLKPFSDERFTVALTRAKQFVRDKRLAELGQRLSSLLADEANPGRSRDFAERLTFRGTGRTYFVSVASIDWIEGAGYYANVHAEGKQHLLRESLTSLTSRLDPSQFIRVHRSAILNVRCVKEIRSSPNRDSIAVMADGTRVRLARGARGRLQSLLDPAAQEGSGT